MNFIRRVFSEADGTPSFSRIASGVIILCGLCWITYVVVTKFVIPEIAGLAALIGTLYGANRISDGIAQIGKGKNPKDVDDPSIP